MITKDYNSLILHCSTFFTIPPLVGCPSLIHHILCINEKHCSRAIWRIFLLIFMQHHIISVQPYFCSYSMLCLPFFLKPIHKQQPVCILFLPYYCTIQSWQYGCFEQISTIANRSNYWVLTNINNMGASQFPTGIQPIPNLSHWEEFNVNKTSQQVKRINYVTFRNKYSGLLIDRYEVGLKNADEQKIYKYQISQRSRDRCVVEVLFYCHETYSEFCINTQKAYVYIQHMPTRLKNIREVKVEEAVYIFSSALHGISRLYDQIGYFQLKQNHFCFNRQGELKVWMNQDLSLNYPQDIGLNSKQRSESSMVAKLIQLVTKNLLTKQSVCNFQQYINARNIKVLSFEHAKRLLKCYCADLQLIVPPRCDSLSNKCPRERSKIKQNITKTNLSSIKARIKGVGLKNQRKDCIKNITLPIYKPMPNQTLNQSMEQSKMVKILWQSAHKRPTSQMKPLSVVARLHERKTTLADGLLSQSSVSCSTRSASRLPSRGFSLSFQEGSCTFGSKRKLHDSKQNQKSVNKLNELTTDNTPRDIIITEKKCKYSTTDISMEVDPSIAEDLRRYL